MQSDFVASNITEIQAAIRHRDAAYCLPVAGNTKSGLSVPHFFKGDEAENASPSGQLEKSVQRISMSAISGIIEYDPSEFLISARSGTPIAELIEALRQHHQYLPFDPLFVADGATLGGTVASGISGPSCLLYGGLRDFVMEVELIDGLGELCRGGGKVVKNAAGFDLPKLVCGSYGRLGCLTELTLKVLPRPETSLWLTTQLSDLTACVQAMQQLRSQPLPISALNAFGDARLQLQLAGPANSLEKLTGRVRDIVPADWTSVTDPPTPLFPGLISDVMLIRVAMDTPQLPAVAKRLQEIEQLSILGFYSSGSVAWLTLADANNLYVLHEALQANGCQGIVVRGPKAGTIALGEVGWLGVARRIQQAIDPHSRFLPFA